MDRALDDVVRERTSRNRNNSRRGPRGGVRKPTRNPRNDYNDDQLWVHDKFDDDGSSETRRREPRIRGSAGRSSDSKVPLGGAKVKVDNIHYDLGEDELLNLFRRQGPVVKLDLLYDRAGRSEGTAFVYYEHEEDAENAIKDFDGANANGQRITLTMVGRGNDGSNPRDDTSRSLFDRIKSPERFDDRRVNRRDPTRKPTPPGIDRYVPPERRGPHSRERDDGRRPPRNASSGRDRRDGRDRSGRGARDSGKSGNGRSTRPKKTAEELDAEMADYFGTDQPNGQETPAPAAPANAAVDEDGDTIL